MPADSKLLNIAYDDYKRRLQAFSEKSNRLRRQCTEESPRLGEIEKELRSLAFDMAGAALRGDLELLSAVKKRSSEINRQRSDILEEKGYPRDFLIPHPMCPECEDYGYKNGAPCSCLLKVYREYQMTELLPHIGQSSFDSFDFNNYSDTVNPHYGVSPRSAADIAYDFCLDYARNFSLNGKYNMYIYGNPGLGKSFLAASVAREVTGKNYYVFYVSAVSMFSWFEKDRFGRLSDDEASDLSRCFSSDLLILDDLGTEPQNASNASSFYRMIDSRITAGRGMIIVSNLSPGDLSQKYSPQIESRIRGLFTEIFLFGEDIRKRAKE